MIFKQNNLTIARDNGVLIRQAKIGDVTYTKGWNLNDFTSKQLADAGITQEEEPVAVVEVQIKTRFTPLEFLDLFTEQEQIAVVSATLQNAQVKLWYDKMLGASNVDIEDIRTIGGLTALVDAGLLTPVRKEEILTPETVG